MTGNHDEVGDRGEERARPRGDLSHRFVVQCVEQWRAKGLPARPLAMMMLAHGVAMLCELDGDEACADVLEDLAGGLGQVPVAGHS